MIPFSPSVLISAASVLAGFGETRQGASRGPFVDCLLRQVSGADSNGVESDASWDTAFVHHAGFWSHFDAARGTSSWPVPPKPDAVALGEYAKEHDVLSELPEPGDIFLMYGPAKHNFVRAGIVAYVGDPIIHSHFRVWHPCVTVEGDTDIYMSLHGGQTLRHWRRFSAKRGDRFVRWTALGRRAVPVHAYPLTRGVVGAIAPSDPRATPAPAPISLPEAA